MNTDPLANKIVNKDALPINISAESQEDMPTSLEQEEVNNVAKPIFSSEDEQASLDFFELSEVSNLGPELESDCSRHVF